MSIKHLLKFCICMTHSCCQPDILTKTLEEDDNIFFIKRLKAAVHNKAVVPPYRYLTCLTCLVLSSVRREGDYEPVMGLCSSIQCLNYSISECPSETLNTAFEGRAGNVGAVTLFNLPLNIYLTFCQEDLQPGSVLVGFHLQHFLFSFFLWLVARTSYCGFTIILVIAHD